VLALFLPYLFRVSLSGPEASEPHRGEALCLTRSFIPPAWT
jgi:hypothetical protein